MNTTVFTIPNDCSVRQESGAIDFQKAASDLTEISDWLNVTFSLLIIIDSHISPYQLLEQHPKYIIN